MQVRSILVLLFYCHIFHISIEPRSFIFADWMSTAKTAKITCPLQYPVLQYTQHPIYFQCTSHFTLSSLDIGIFKIELRNMNRSDTWWWIWMHKLDQNELMIHTNYVCAMATSDIFMLYHVVFLNMVLFPFPTLHSPFIIYTECWDTFTEEEDT